MVAAALVAAAAVSACSVEGGGRGGSNAVGVHLPPSAAPGPQGADQRTSIGSASQQDVAAGLRANGVPEPEYWAQVVLRNRPYPAEDPGLGKLRQVLAQQGADGPTSDRIINALRP